MSIARSLVSALTLFGLVIPAVHAARVTWRASGVITTVGTYTSTLPFTPAVGQPFVLDMVLENDASAVSCGNANPNVMSCSNIFSATLYVGNNQMILTPSNPWATTLWNDYVLGSNKLDYYNMPIVDATTQWEARWTVQTQVAAGTTGPMTSLALLQSPPDVNAFTGKEMALTPGAGNYAPAVVASLNSVTVVGPNAPSPTASPGASAPGEDGGGGQTSLWLILILAAAGLIKKQRGSRSLLPNASVDAVSV